MREYQLMFNTLKKFGLDLTGRTVFTEAASNAFLWTPIMAALAGAEQVFAVSGSSKYGSFEEICNETMRHARNLNVEDRIVITRDKDQRQIAQADIVTNLGFVRPLDKQFVDSLNPGAVICLMWEPWEFRSGEIDLAACDRRGIPVLGTNERDPRLQTYRYVAMTVIKLLLEHEIEIFDTDLLILGSGHFVGLTAHALTGLGARVYLDETDLPGPPDCVVCLEHHNHDCLIGDDGVFRLADCDGLPLILHICGNVDSDCVKKHGSRLVPPIPATCGFMSFTTGHVGPKPVIDLHAAGLKVGQAWLEQDKNELARLAKSLPKVTAAGRSNAPN